MSAINKSSDKASLLGLSSAATHLFSQVKAADRYAAIHERLGAAK